MSADIEELPDGVVELDGTRVITAANAAVSKLTGHAPESLRGRSCAEALEPRDDAGKALLVNGWHPSTRLGQVTEIPEHEVVLSRADGTDVRTFVTGRYHRDASGAVTGATLMLRDAGRRRELAAAGAQVVSTVSHELRSPLTSVKGYTSLLLSRWDRVADDDKKMMLEQVNRDADRVTRLITELLDINRLASGRLVLRRQMLDLHKLVDTVIGQLRMEHTDMEVTVELPEDLSEVYADPDKVVQVVTNLVENACKYASPKGLRVVAHESPTHVIVDVIDRGEGIPAEDLPKVFNRFFRRAEGKPTGSGLGLWISRGLVRAHGGNLEVSSVVGTGTTFTFSLPKGAFEEANPG